MIENEKQLEITMEMLKGNINRIIITSDSKELKAMQDYAINRIYDICLYKYIKIQNIEKEVKI